MSKLSDQAKACYQAAMEMRIPIPIDIVQELALEIEDMERLPRIVGTTPRERTNALLRECAMRLWASADEEKDATVSDACEWSLRLVKEMRELGWLEWESRPTRTSRSRRERS